MSVTSDFWFFFLLVCPDASNLRAHVESCPRMCVGVKVVGSQNSPCFCMGPCPLALTPFVVA